VLERIEIRLKWFRKEELHLEVRDWVGNTSCAVVMRLMNEVCGLRVDVVDLGRISREAVARLRLQRYTTALHLSLGLYLSTKPAIRPIDFNLYYQYAILIIFYPPNSSPHLSSASLHQTF
jgi:hypothetical protein